MAIADEVVWTLNDSAIPPSPCPKARFWLHWQCANVDWESLAQDESHFFVADTGNNLNSCDRLVIYRKPRLIQRTSLQSLFRSDMQGMNRAICLPIILMQRYWRCGDELWLFSKRGMAIQISIDYPSCPAIMSLRLANPAGAVIGHSCDIHPKP